MKKSFLTILLASAAAAAGAQSYNTSSKELVEECRRLNNDKEYSALLVTMEGLNINSLGAIEREEMEFLRARGVFGNDHLQGRALLLQHLADYPESANKDIISALIGESYYYSKNFELAAEWFGKADFERIDPQESERCELHYALTLQECGEEEKARNTLATLCVTGKHYTTDAQFHLAVAQYNNDELEKAYEGLKKVESSDSYYLEVPYYIAGIYVKQGKFQQAQQIAENFIADHSDKPQGTAMQQMLGAALFGQGNHSEAATPLKKYLDDTNYKKQQRIARYQYAICLYEAGNLDEAKDWFLSSCGKDDAITQNSRLHLGMIHAAQGNTNEARFSFEQAANMGFDSEVSEKALYNYALCLHSTRYSPFAESVKTFERFLNEYPKSEHCGQVNKYLVEVYMNTRNYDVALESINKIAAPSPVILQAKQKILYRLGIQAFIDGNMDTAIDYFNQSISLKEHDKKTHSEALYWRGEAYYAKEQYATAASNFRSAVALGGDNAGKATYGLGYTYFQRSQTDAAEKEFLRFLKMAKRDEKELYADACNRIADCNFFARDYHTAETYYTKAVEAASSNSDYSLYQKAIAQGLRKDYKAKIATLGSLIGKYPASDHIQQGYYEKGRAHIEIEENDKAIATFEQLIAAHPGSDLSRRAAAERAMLLNAGGNHAKAIEAYKDIIARYPHSDEAHTAAQDLKNLYVEQGNVAEYAQYAANTPGMKAVKSSEIDTLTYIAAEKIYGRGDTNTAIVKFEEYIEKFPEGAFTLDSHYYLGVSHYNKKETAKALPHFEKVTGYPDNKYSEEAMAYASDIYYNDKQWSKAMPLYRSLIEKSSNADRKAACRLNLLRCAYNTDDEQTPALAKEILAKDAPAPDNKREVEYYLAKSLLKKGSAEAEAPLIVLAKDTRTVYGAEAKYLLAQMYYDTKNYDDCEKVIFDYIDASTPHAYWLARSFILLADLYTAQGREQEAKQYLLSLQGNYNADDDIEELTNERLNKLSATNN